MVEGVSIYPRNERRNVRCWSSITRAFNDETSAISRRAFFFRSSHFLDLFNTRRYALCARVVEIFTNVNRLRRRGVTSYTYLPASIVVYLLLFYDVRFGFKSNLVQVRRRTYVHRRQQREPVRIPLIGVYRKKCIARVYRERNRLTRRCL